MYRLLTPVISKIACLLISLSKIGERENFNKLKCVIVAVACLALPSVGSAVQVMPGPGFNLGNTLESTWGYTHPTQALINSIADAGFKTLRVPCAWDFNSPGNGSTIDPAYMTEVANVVDWALAKNMYVIINDHWDGGWFDDSFNTYSSTLNSKLINIWTQVANRFKNYDSTKLSFACANEPVISNQTQNDVLYQYYQNWINAMRANGGNNATRWLIIQAGSVWDWNVLLNYGRNMPTDSAGKLMIEEHTYDPGEFTTQDSDSGRYMKYFWGSAYHVTGSLESRNCIAMEESYLQDQFAKLKAAFVDRGYPVLIGEWAAQPKPTSVTELTGQYRDQNFRSTTYYCKYMENLISSFGFSGTYFAGQGDSFDPTTGAVVNQDRLNSILGISALPAIAGLNNPTPPPAPLANGTYKIIARHSGKALKASGTAAGSLVQQYKYPKANNTASRWTVTSIGNGQYSIVGVASGKPMSIVGNSTADGANVDIENSSTSNAQKWTITNVGGGYYQVLNVNSGKALDVYGASISDGASVVQWTWGGGTNQQWSFLAP